MVRMDDIYTTIDNILLENNYWGLDDSEKVEQVELALRTYLAKKLAQIDTRDNVSEERLKNLPVIGLIQLIEYQMDPDVKQETLAHVIHYIINIASNIQEYAVVWHESEEIGYKWQPATTFNQDRKWDTLTTHKLTPYTEIYKSAYYALKNVVSKYRKQ